MLHLTINADYSTLYDESNHTGIRNKTSCFLGNIITMLENEFPKAQADNPSFFISDLVEELQGNPTKAKQIWGIKERGTSLLAFYDFIDGREAFYPSMLDVEHFRLIQRIKNAPLVSLSGDISYSVQTVFQVIYALLYYYAYNEMLLKRCKFCNQWFAIAKESAQSNFCERAFVYTDCLGKKHSYTTCQVARETISARLKSRSQAIYHRLYDSSGIANGKLNFFVSDNQKYRERIKKNPSATNILQYEKFLYIDCETLCSRYGR